MARGRDLDADIGVAVLRECLLAEHSEDSNGKGNENSERT
jgi:hypothetical protein